MPEDQRALSDAGYRKNVGNRRGSPRSPMMGLSELVAAIETVAILGDTHGVVVTALCTTNGSLPHHFDPL